MSVSLLYAIMCLSPLEGHNGCVMPVRYISAYVIKNCLIRQKKTACAGRLTGLRTCCFSIKDAEAVLFLCGSFFGCYGLAQLLLNLLGKLRVVFKQVLGAIAALGKLGAVVAEP